MNEIDKMRNSQLADMEKPEIQASFIHAKKLVAQLRMMSTYDDGFREVLEELVPGIPSTSVICPRTQRVCISRNYRRRLLDRRRSYSLSRSKNRSSLYYRSRKCRN